ncbi:MAG: choline/carnitine O-acyltransferase [Pseudonocardia sp.]|nr:choline/carnitine O-acyltransferase [Pseudonocardia sp.]
MTTIPALSDRTFGNEDGLPRVPLPSVAESCDRFLDWCAPLLDARQLATTEAAVAHFREVAGPLQDELIAYDASPGVHSWLDEFWDRRYLGRRDRIALNANFFFLFTDSGHGQIERAAALLSAALAQKALIDAETLPPTAQRGLPVSMQQHRYLFSTTRVPGAVQDTVRTPYSDASPGPSTERHIVVAVRGHLLRMDVIDEHGRPHSLDELAAGLLAAQDAAPGRGPALGSLTSKARAEWAASRAALIALDPANAAALDEIERALLCVCLEDRVPDGPLAAADQLLHGDSGNRWFDKAVSLIVFADGTAGYNGEHCRLDGTTVIAFLDAVLAASAPMRLGATAGRTPAVAPIDVVLDDALRADITAAAESFTAYAAATATITLSVDFSAERAKALACSPDAFAQLAYQLAHQRAKGLIGATYESISTRSFHHGRTEAMRVVTPEIVAFVAAMQDTATSAAARAAAARAAADAHVARARQCQSGEAPEQHLWALQMINQQRGGPDIPLFGSPGWLVMRDDFLSTSAVPSPQVRYWGFGSTSQKCIGVGYAMLPDRFDLYLSTPETVRAPMLDFARELPLAVAELEALFARDPAG